MQLKSITLSGFKSFADLTTFPIQSALTGIIGPNGCGKSNIIDAVRWVLGENTAKHLRASSASEVIFGGAAKRKASQFAQVSLHFDNSDGGAGGAFSLFSEIVISRKINSEGQSSYFINQKTVRRRDIIELLQGAGVGARSYAVIEQGMISRIIEAKPEELRGFIEEAAGIALYKNRRRESEKRMFDTEQHVLLHEERLKSLANQRDTLEQQAVVARQFQTLKTQHQQKQHRLRSYQYHEQSQAISELEHAQTQAQSALENLQVEQQHDALHAAQSALQHAQQHRAQQQAQLQHQQTLHQQQQTQRQTELAHQSHHQQRALEQTQRLARLHEQLQQNQAESLEQQSALDALRAAIDHHAPELETLQLALHDKQQQVQRQQRQLEQQQQQKQHLAQQIRQHEQQAATLRHNLQTWRQRLQQLQQSALPTLRPFDHHARERAQTHTQTTQSALFVAEKAEQSAREQHLAAQSALNHANEQCQRLRDQIEVLSQTLPKIELGPDFADLPLAFTQLQIAPLWQNALSRYLAPLLSMPCGEGKALWQSALSSGQAYTSRGDIPLLWQGIIRGAVDVDLWLSHLTPLEQHDAEIDPQTLDPNTRYLTLDGTLISRASVAPQALDAQAHLHQRLHALHEALPERELACEHAREHALQQQQQWQRAEESREQSALAHQTATQETQRLDHDFALWQQEAAHHQALLAQQQHSQSALQEDIARAEEEYSTVQISLESLQEQLLILNEQPSLDPEQTQREQSALAELRQQSDRAQQLQQQRQQQFARQQAFIESQQQRAQSLHAEIEQLKQEQQLNQNTQQEQQLQLETLALALEESALQLETTREALQHAEQREHVAQNHYQQLERQHHEQQSNQKLHQQRLQHLEQQIQLLRQQQSALHAEWAEENRQPIAFAPDEVVDTVALHSEIRTLAQQMEALGAVNLSALSEFERVRHEHDELERQCLDLRSSLQLLKTAIQTLDNETRIRLKTTLEQVNTHFAALFPRLFNGGEAFLSWEAGDILEAGVSITVRPPGKKLKNITALSGGEKALSALALVFALFRLNPAPFCLLDEVDAPLDEANVGRLCALLQEMAKETQFVIITHHKKTMQHCERLIGVTMSEPGVSRLVAVEVHRA